MFVIMKKFFVLIVLFSFAGFSQPLSGNYLIGASQAAPFNTLTNAVNKLNGVGISGPVVFLLNDATYTVSSGEVFPIAINQFSGSSETNTFTIRPNAGKTVLIQADNINSYTSTQSVIKLNGADNVLINGSNNNSASKNLTIANTNSIEYSKKSVIWFANEGASNGAVNNTVSNLNIRQQNFTGDLSVGIYSGGTAVDAVAATSANSNNTIDNVVFTKVGQGVYITGNAATQNWKIMNSVFGASADADKSFVGIYLNNVKNYTISNNTIDGILKTTTNYNPIHGGIYTDGSSSDGKIFGNKISNIKETTGSASSTGIFVTGNNTAVYNNFINNVRAQGNGGLTNNGFGIYINSGQAISIYYNTVKMVDSQNSGFSAALCVAAGSALNVANNIFMNTQTSGAARYAVYSAVSASAFAKIDYNDYYSTQNIGYLGGNAAALSNWKTATAQDSHSVNLLPIFSSATDLHLSTTGNTVLDNLGTPITTILLDIDSEIRSTTTPDIGADEFDAAKCGNTTIWSGSSWNNGSPTTAYKAIIAANYSTASGNITACELVVNAGIVLTINKDQYVEIQNDATINGNVVVENGGSFVQVKEDSKDVLSATGTFTMKRTTSPITKYDFVYWSSPIENQSLYNLSPETRFDKFYKFNPLTGAWVVIENGAETMENGKGYIVRGPASFSDTVAAPFNASFTGKPHNGPVSVPVMKSVSAMNLIGNPYPSAIDAKAFLNDSNNSSLLNGTIYLWTHATPIQQNGVSTYGYSSADYAAYNKIGGIKTSATSAAFAGKIAAGQAFFVETLATGTAVFKNSMRIKANNTQFYKTSNPVQALEKDNRFWLNLMNDQGAFKQTLIGYANGASNGYDQQYDGLMVNGNSYINFYTIVENQNLVIQGLALPFDNQQVIPLGYSTTVAGTFTIALDGYEGLFSGQEIYLVDKLLNTVQNIKSGNYNFTTATGTFNDRFEVRFSNETLATNDVSQMQQNTVAFSDNDSVSIKSTETIETVKLFDLNGKLLFSKQNINAKEFSTGALNIKSQLLILQAASDKNAIYTQKIPLK